MSKLQALLQALKARAPTTHEVVGVDRTCEHSGDGQVDCEYWRALSAIGSHGATAGATRRAPATALRLGARRRTGHCSHDRGRLRKALRGWECAHGCHRHRPDAARRLRCPAGAEPSIRGSVASQVVEQFRQEAAKFDQHRAALTAERQRRAPQVLGYERSQSTRMLHNDTPHTKTQSLRSVARNLASREPPL